MLAHSLPSQPVRAMGADRVIAVNLKSTWSNVDGPRHIFDVIGQCFSIAQDMNCAQARACADLVIEPDVTGYRYDDFEHSAELVRIGEETAPRLTATNPQMVRSDRRRRDETRKGEAANYFSATQSGRFQHLICGERCPEPEAFATLRR